ncbi:hypothetical protein BC937DRAFT_94107 [Endogone sp. FLAS-F59071]|nr:hypothetical protein BC937DRAFT_94107 [Endogone sp. FLAS-F59071]|eukprot:RUS22987.1 hypothetical protein BC937DRAFT_94107 [Endogone sp. FLAS-F59071]
MRDRTPDEALTLAAEDRCNALDGWEKSCRGHVFESTGIAKLARGYSIGDIVIYAAPSKIESGDVAKTVPQSLQ